MPTIIDSLVVTLGLDPSGFTKGQKDAAAAMIKTKEAALKQSKELEEANNKFAESFNHIKIQAAELFAVIAGATGVKSFIADVTAATAALGRLSANINVSPQELGAWGLAIERIGGDAAEAASDFQTLSDQLFQLKQNGKNIPEALQKMGAEAHVPIDYNHGLPAYLRSIAKAAAELTRLHGGDRSDSFNFLKQAGIGPGMAQVLLDNGAALDKYIGSLKDLAPTDDQIKKFEALQTQLAALQQTVYAVGRDIATYLTPYLVDAARFTQDWVEANKQLASSTAFAWLTTIKNDAQAVADVLNKIVEAENWLGSHGLGAAGAALANKFGPQSHGSGEATPIPWGDWFHNIGKYFGMGAQAGESGPGSHPHPPAGLFLQGQQVSRGNPMPVTVVAGTETGGSGGLLSWLFGGGSPTSQGAAIASGASGVVAGAAKGIAKWLGSGAVGTPGASNGSMDSRAMQLMDRLVKVHGWTPEAAAIAAGNAQQESGVRSDGPMGDPSTPGGSWGMFQWNRGRLAALKEYAASQKANWQDFNTQVDFFNQEARAKIPTWAAQHSLAGAGSISHAYEGFGDNSEGTRVGNSARFLKLYNSRGADPGHTLPHRPVSHTPLSTMSALHPVTTSSTSNSLHIDQLHVNAKHATDAYGIANHISDALRQSAFVTSANFGQA